MKVRAVPKGQVKVPNVAEGKFSAAGLGKERTFPEHIHGLAELLDYIVVHK